MFIGYGRTEMFFWYWRIEMFIRYGRIKMFYQEWEDSYVLSGMVDYFIILGVPFGSVTFVVNEVIVWHQFKFYVFYIMKSKFKANCRELTCCTVKDIKNIIGTIEGPYDTTLYYSFRACSGMIC